MYLSRRTSNKSAGLIFHRNWIRKKLQSCQDVKISVQSLIIFFGTATKLFNTFNLSGKIPLQRSSCLSKRLESYFSFRKVNHFRLARRRVLKRLLFFFFFLSVLQRRLFQIDFGDFFTVWLKTNLLLSTE